MDIEVDAKFPFRIGATPIVRIGVSSINFMGYASCFQTRLQAQARGMDAINAEKAFMRERRLKQCVAYDKQNNAIELTHEAFAAMPRKLFVAVHNAVDNWGGSPRGKVLSPKDADGISAPVVYELGSPFVFEDTKADQKAIGTKQEVIELEFLAKTGGDIEEVLCANNNIDQTVALIKACATPLGGDAGLLRLPSWMLDSLSVADGFAIMAEVLPVFTE